jgi:hypothetical protein
VRKSLIPEKKDPPPAPQPPTSSKT